MEKLLELRLEPLWETAKASDEYTSSFSSSTGAVLLGRGGCEPPAPKWKVDLPLASRRHCWFQHAESSEDILVVDVSRGGTFINSTAVSRSKGTPLRDGEILSLLKPWDGRGTVEPTRAWKAHIQHPGNASPARPPEVRPMVSFQIARPKAAGYTAEARDFLERIGRTGEVPEVPQVQSAANEHHEPEPEEGSGKEEPEEEAHSDQQVIEAAQQLSQLQLETKDTTEAAAPEPEAQYAIIDTNQLLDHLDAVNSMLEHVVGVNIIVPIVVLHELDYISRRENSTATPARLARSFLVGVLSSQRCSSGQERSSISLQEMVESVASETTGVRPNNDDQILACALYFATRVAPSRTEVFTEDRGLQIKLRARAVPTESVNACLTRGLARTT